MRREEGKANGRKDKKAFRPSFLPSPSFLYLPSLAFHPSFLPSSLYLPGGWLKVQEGRKELEEGRPSKERRWVH